MAAIAFAAGALSCASVRPATRVHALPPPAVGAPVEPSPLETYSPPPPLVAAPPGLDETPSSEAPPAAEIVAPSPPAAAMPAPPSSNRIALVLPLDEPAFARAASAVRDGFLDAAAAAGRGNDCVVIAHRGGDDVVGAFEIAREKGVQVAVGPLVRDDLKTLASATVTLPWTLALNQLDDGTPLPPAIYAFPLTVESDGRTLAKRARASVAAPIDVIQGDSPLMKRLASSFAIEWTGSGGSPPSVLRFEPSPDALGELRKTLGRNPPRAVLLAVTGDHAALVKPFIGNVLAYASGLVFERPNPAVARDLDDVRVVEIPWLLTPDAPQFASIPHRDFDSDALARLYALGHDAFTIAAAFHDGPPDRFEVDGATGHVTLVPGHLFQREAMLGVYRDGRLVPLDSTP
jgi:outer membrane PBP1 activator LpoA protein